MPKQMLSRFAISLAVMSATALAQPVPTEPDSWSSTVTWRSADGWYATGIHATLMPDGRILFIGYERDQADPALATQQRRSAFLMPVHPQTQPLPAEEVVVHLAEPVEADGTFVPPYLVFDDLFCSGHTLTAEGLFFSAGGSRYLYNVVDQQSLVVGLPYATVSDGNAWLRLEANMVGVANLEGPARWYPTCTRLPDGRIMVTGGYDLVDPIQLTNRSVETFDPASGVWNLLSDAQESPETIVNGDYTHPVVLPQGVNGFDVLMFGQAGVPVEMATTPGAPAKWFEFPFARPDTQPGQVPNNGASTALLPIRFADGEWGYHNGSVLIAGGQHATSHQRAVDVFDPAGAAWKAKIDTGVPRHHPTAVVLPTGRVLIVAGHDMNGDPNVRRNTYVDPRDGFKVTLGADSSQEVRGYHHVALLLPDGRVLIGGGRDLSTVESAEKVTFRYYSPPYMDQPRPRIAKVPNAINYDSAAFIESRGARPGEVVLMSLGSMTHSFDANQRYVQLGVANVVKLANGAFQTTVATPADSRVAPPGVYMLFVLDRFGVPSKATMVTLGG